MLSDKAGGGTRPVRLVSHTLKAESFLRQATALARAAATEPLPQRRGVLLAAAERLVTLAAREMPSSDAQHSVVQIARSWE